MKRQIPIVLLLVLLASFAFKQRIVDEQLRYPRVRDAKADYHYTLENLFTAQQVAFPPKNIYLRSFKFDKKVELWATSDGQNYDYIKSYDICKLSGELGPKRQQGDLQIPEGFYNLEYFNPASSYHLSMKVDYPNASDRILGKQGSLGGDIFIHGECVTIGCIPLENEPMKELYWLSVLTKGEGGNIPIHIYPFKMDDASVQFFKKIDLFDDGDWRFWNQLKPAYAYFNSCKQIPKIEIDSRGNYIVETPANWAKQ